MPLSTERINETAARLIREVNDNYDYSDVHEDEDVNELTDDPNDWEAIFDAMIRARLDITIDGKLY